MIIGLGLFISLGTLLPASGHSANSSDSLTITVTPAGERGVIIDTTSINLGALALGTTHYTGGAEGVVVVTTGSIAPIEYTIEGDIFGGWFLSADGHADTQDEVAVHALFNSTQPTINDFEGPGNPVGKHLLTTATGSVGDAAGKYEGNQELDNMGLNVSRNLWFQLKLPPTSTTTAEQIIVMTITAEAAN